MSSLRPTLAGATLTFPLPTSCQPAFDGLRLTASTTFSKYRFATGPPIVTSVSPPFGSTSICARRVGVIRQELAPRRYLIGAESIVLIVAATGSRSSTVTSGTDWTTGTATRVASVPRQGREDERLGACTVDSRARLTRDDHRIEPVELERRGPGRGAQLLLQPVEVVLDRGVVGPRGRLDVLARDPEPDPLEAAQRQGAAARVDRLLRSVAPVDPSTCSSAGLIVTDFPAATSVSEARVRAAARDSSRSTASSAVSPPTSTPAIVTPSAIVSDEPAKPNPAARKAKSAVAATRSRMRRVRRPKARESRERGLPPRSGRCLRAARSSASTPISDRRFYQRSDRRPGVARLLSRCRSGRAARLPDERADGARGRAASSRRTRRAARARRPRR